MLQVGGHALKSRACSWNTIENGKEIEPILDLLFLNWWRVPLGGKIMVLFEINQPRRSSIM